MWNTGVTEHVVGLYLKAMGVLGCVYHNNNEASWTDAG